MDLIGYLISLKRVFVSGGLGKSGFEGEFSANYSNAVMILNRLPKLDFSLRGLVNSLIVLLSNDYCVIAVIFLAKQNFFVTLEEFDCFRRYICVGRKTFNGDFHEKHVFGC